MSKTHKSLWLCDQTRNDEDKKTSDTNMGAVSTYISIFWPKGFGSSHLWAETNKKGKVYQFPPGIHGLELISDEYLLVFCSFR